MQNSQTNILTQRAGIDMRRYLILKSSDMRFFKDDVNTQDYLDEKDRITKKIVRRQTRGNVKAQNGESSSKDKLLLKSRKADVLLERTSALIEAG